jgi:hypothetical protein
MEISAELELYDYNLVEDNWGCRIYMIAAEIAAITVLMQLRHALWIHSVLTVVDQSRLPVHLV